MGIDNILSIFYRIFCPICGRKNSEKSTKKQREFAKKIIKKDKIFMRIDKFLKVSRVIKRRSVAADACDGGRIEINGKVAKPSKDVKIGDVVQVSFGNNTLRFEVLDINEKQTKQSAENMYRVLE